MHVVVVLAVFVAAGVEFVEAFTILLAAQAVGGWRPALWGTFGALAALAALVAVFGYAILALFPIGLFRALIGLILLLFGLKWLRKAVLRSSGRQALHDETLIYERNLEHLRAAREQDTRSLAFATAFNGVLLEGVEVIFIVLTLGAPAGTLTSAVLGAAAAFVVVAVAGLLLRTPLSRVPENTLKWIVGVMLSAFGTFWAGEGVGVAWWDQDISIIVLVVLFAALSLGLRAWVGRSRQGAVA